MKHERAAYSKITIVGAGAMGCLFAVRLAVIGIEVTVVDVDSRRLDLIERAGLNLTDDEGTHSARVAGVSAADAGPAEVIILLTKGVHSAAAVNSVAHLARNSPVALTLQNGIGNAELLAECFGSDRVLLGSAHVPADLKGPTSVVSHGTGSVEIGGLTEASHQWASSVVELLRRARFDAAVAADIHASVWEKLAFNAALNAPATICRVPNGGLDNAPGRRLAARIVDEAVAVATAIGIRVDAGRVIERVTAALRDHPFHKASMLQDRELGRPTEIETINGAISSAGARLGVRTVACDTLCDLVRVIEISESAMPSSTAPR